LRFGFRESFEDVGLFFLEGGWFLGGLFRRGGGFGGDFRLGGLRLGFGGWLGAASAA